MKKNKALLIALTFSFTMAAEIALADVFVNGYTRSDGTRVEGHWRSSPDSSHNNNWSTQGNTNPYTGRSGSQPRTYDDNAPDYNLGGGCINCLN